MATDLTAIKAVLTALTDAELHALIAATNAAPPIAYGLLGWIEGACDWELNRRARPRLRAAAARGGDRPGEDAVSIDAAIELRDQFAKDSPAALAFFDALVALLTGTGRKH